MQTAILPSRPVTGAASRALWLVRWLLVLLLIWDQVSSPLHHHRHDSGVDAQWMGASQGVPETSAHLEDLDDGSRFAHAVMAVRPQLDLACLAPQGDPVEAIAAGPVWFHA